MREKFKNRDGIICDGSIRAGKTVAMTVGFVLWSMNSFDGHSFALCGKTIESLRRNIVAQLPVWVEGLYTIHESRKENKLIISGGGHTNIYYMFGGKDESSYMLVQGLTLAGVLFDEVALMPESFVNQATARCSIAGSKFWFNCNPESPMHWFYLEWVKHPEKHNVLHIHYTMDDNLSLTPEIKQRYYNQYHGVFFRRYILGEWVKAEGLVYPMFSRDDHVLRGSVIAPQQGHRYYASIDYGTVNPFAIGVYDYDPEARIATMIREVYHAGSSNDRVDNEAYYEMLDSVTADLPIEYVVIDPSAASMIETIQKYGRLLVVRARNDVLDGIQDVTRFMNAGCLQFHESCIKTFEEFELYSWDDKSGGDRVKKEHDHSMDQLRYFVRTVLRNELKWIV